MSKQPTFRIVLLFAVSVALFGGGFTYWAQAASSDSHERYTKLVREVPDELDLVKQVEASQKTVEETKTQLQHLEEGVPGMAYVPTLLTDLENLGKQHNIAVTGVRPVIEPKTSKSDGDKKSGSKKAAYQEMLIDITGRGSYGDVMRMVEALKQFPKVVGITSVGMQPRRDQQQAAAGQTPTGVLLDTTVRIRAYLFPMPVTASKGQPAAGTNS